MEMTPYSLDSNHIGVRLLVPQFIRPDSCTGPYIEDTRAPSLGCVDVLEKILDARPRIVSRLFGKGFQSLVKRHLAEGRVRIGGVQTRAKIGQSKVVLDCGVRRFEAVGVPIDVEVSVRRFHVIGDGWCGWGGGRIR